MTKIYCKITTITEAVKSPYFVILKFPIIIND